MAKGKGASVYGEEVKCQKESDKKFQIFCKRLTNYVAFYI